jgi:hypothetical protein
MISIFTFNNVVSVIVIQFLQFRQKEEMEVRVKSAVPENKLHLILIEKGGEDKIEWFESNKEFQYEGMMYDIVRQVRQGSSTKYYCLTDTEETQMVETLEKLLDHQSAHSKATNLLKKSYRLFCNQFELLRFEIESGYICTNNWFSLIENFLSLYHTDIPTPPPKYGLT